MGVPLLQRSLFCCFIIISWFSISTDTFADTSARVHGNHGVGALGRIEPRSRVIKISHNAGPEGARVQQLLIQEGDLVISGDKLAVLSDDLKRKAEVGAARTFVTMLEAQLKAEKYSLTFNRREFKRYQSLQQDVATSESQTDSKRLALQQSETTIERLSAEIANARFKQKIAEAELDNAFIYAPITGTVLKILTRPGERIKENGLLEMADLSQLDVVAEVYEVDLLQIKTGQQALISATGWQRAYQAQVREIGFQVKKNDLNDTDPLADTDNRIVEVRLTLEAEAVDVLRHQIFRQVKVRFLP